MGRRLEAYFDKQLTPEESREYETHLGRCERCTRVLEDYATISRALDSLAREELRPERETSYWPEIRSRLIEEVPTGWSYPARKKLWLWRRPAWIGLAVSAAAALIIYFSGVLVPGRLPANYCRIDKLAAPDHNVMIYQDKSDGFTIIWLME